MVAVFVHTSQGQSDFLIREPAAARCLWEVGQHNHCTKRDNDRERAFNEE